MENFLKNLKALTGVPIETIFTVLATLFVFGMGILSNWIINLLKERNQRRDYRNTINLLLDNLSEICKKQYLNTTKRLETYSILNNKSIGIQLHVYTPLFFLNKMDYSLFIKNYVRGCNKTIKAKASAKVFKNIGYTNTFEHETVETAKYFFEALKPHQELYIKNILLIESFGRELPILEFVDFDFKDECLHIYKSWEEQQKDNNFTHSFTHLISPLKRLFDRFSLEPKATRLLNLIIECHQAYSDIVHTDRRLQEHFNRFASENKQVYSELKIALKVLGHKPAYNLKSKRKKNGFFRRFQRRRLK